MKLRNAHHVGLAAAGLALAMGVSISGCGANGGRSGIPAGLSDEDPEDDGWPPPNNDGPDTSATTGTDDEGTTSGGEGDEDPGETGNVPLPMPPDVGTCSSAEDCIHEDAGSCFVAQGTCEFGNCFFDPKPPGSACDDGNLCTEGDNCDAEGACVGMPRACPFAHGVGVCLQAGDCGGPLSCDEGFADCNGDAEDGCEVELGTTSACGGCGDVCSGGPHVASTSCDAGECSIACEGSWEDCDGDAANGCEIPAGIPNQCDANGLNPNGCWTAHCGSSANPDAVNFGSWFCFECTNCQPTVPGSVHWCSHSSGLWFPDNVGGCVVDSVDYTDLVCLP